MTRGYPMGGHPHACEILIPRNEIEKAKREVRVNYCQNKGKKGFPIILGGNKTHKRRERKVEM